MDGGEPFPFVQEIDAFCAENNVVLLYATVTGSRAMGLAGPNSDFDVRGVVVRPLSSYLTLDEPNRKLDSWSQESGQLDLQLWDVRKVCSLLASSNQRALEMVFSPLVVADRFGFAAKLKERALAALSLSRLALHFVNDAEMHYSRFIAPFQLLDCKKYIFLLRSVFAIRAIERTGAMPPVEYAELCRAAGAVPAEVTASLSRLLELKLLGATLDRPREPVLEQFYLASNLAEAARRIVASSEKQPDKTHFDQLICETVLLNPIKK